MNYASTLKEALQKPIDDPAVLTKSHGLIASNFRAAATGSQTTFEAVKSGSGLVAAGAVSAAKSVMAKLQADTAPNPAPAAAVPVKEEHPSYLAGGTVALALMGSLLKQQGTASATGFTDVKSAIDNMPASNLKEALQASALQANQDIDALRQGIATWFDDSIDRLSGAYKRKMKWIAMLIGLVVAIAFNADSFNVATTLWNDADRRASAVEVAIHIAKKPLPAPGQSGSQQGDLKKGIANTEDTLPPVGRA